MMKTPHILWIDDEIDLLKPYIIFLEQKGYQVTCSNNGFDAVDLCKQNSFDIVFLDENMPGLSGLETLTDIKNIQPSLPVVMITKSEEENIMDMAIGEKITDYLIKPVKPNQILLSLKKHLHIKEIQSEHTDANYRQEFQDIAYLINTANSIEEFMAIEKLLVHWDLELQNTDSQMHDLLLMQRQQANATFAKYISKNYQSWFEPNNNQRPTLSQDIFKKYIFPKLDNGEKLFFIVIDNFRYDQWKAIQEIVADFFTIADEQMYCTILPTATQYARNAIFSGLLPLQIQQMYPEYWVEENEDEGKNLNEQELIKSQIERFRRHDSFTYQKINESDFCEKVISRLHTIKTPLNVIVLNFIDMLSHSRTESKMMRELANDEAAYRSLTKSWFRHSPTYQLFKRISELGYTIVLTTDHGTIKVNNPIMIVGDKNTNNNLRYKVGKSLSVKSKEVFKMDNPKLYGLPSPNVSSSYVYATGNDFFGYPNNFNYYAQYYRNTFQHGGISMEEMLVPIVTLQPK